MIWFPTKDKVQRELVDLLARSCRAEQSVMTLADRMNPLDDLLGKTPEIQKLRAEVSEGSRVISVASVALQNGQISPRSISKRLPNLEARVSHYERLTLAMTASYETARS